LGSLAGTYRARPFRWTSVRFGQRWDDQRGKCRVAAGWRLHACG
jgi:hypothetical protein